MFGRRYTVACAIGWGVIGVLLGVLTKAPLALATPALTSLDLENMNSAELDELLGQLTAQESVVATNNDRHHHQALDHGPMAIAMAAALQPQMPAGMILQHAFQEHVQPPSSVHIINDCMTISMEEGVFHYKAAGNSEQVCGLYLVADPDKSIIVTVDYLDVDCKRGGLISVVDGWELNGQVFPGAEDHEKPLSARFHEMCGLGRKVEQRYTSSQNAAVIQYRVPVMGEGFTVRVKHIKNPRPCNILVQDTEGEFTLQNHGRRVNCSLTALYDAKIRIMYLSTDGRRASMSSGLKYSRSVQRGLAHKCEKHGSQDFLQIGGSSGLETSKMEVVDDLCGHGSLVGSRPTTIFCGMTTVRLVSSGAFSNKVTVQIQKADLEDLEEDNHICGL